MAKYDDYVYPNSTVLRNKFGLQDELAAHTMETRLAYVRIAELVQNPVQGDYDLAHLLEINRRAFQDMYDWAGKLRDVPTGTTNTQLVHCLPEHLEEQSRYVFRMLQRDDLLQGMGDDQFNDRLAYHWGELTALHPSLNGNTRSQRVFVDQLTQQAGRSINWAAVNQNIEAFKMARLHAHAGNHLPLRDQLAQVVRPAGLRTDGTELAGPAVDPKVTQAALSGLAAPTTSSAQSSTATKERTAKPRGRDGQELS
ncbi:Fic/DOC family protein [Kribbella sp. NPDC054772]